MPWIYMFDECGPDTKIGKASRHYHDRFRDQQPCNPRVLVLRSAVQFDTLESMGKCETELKKGSEFPFTDRRFPKREWYGVAWQKALCSKIWKQHGGVIQEIHPYTKAFRDDLNSGDLSNKYRLHAYVFAEESLTIYSKLRLTAYGWEAARTTYLTGNPHNVIIHSRWLWPDNESARAFERSLSVDFRAQHVHFGWYSIGPDVLARLIAQSGAKLAPRRQGDSSESDATGGRIEVGVGTKLRQ